MSCYHYYKCIDSQVDLPIDLMLVKQHLKIPTAINIYDEYLNSAIRAVTTYVERIVGVSLLQKTWELYLDDFCCDIRLRRRPNATVTSIEYLVDNVWTTISSLNYYVTFSDAFSDVCPADGYDWPTPDNRKQAVKITFTTGYGTCFDAVPYDLKMAMLQHITDLYSNRGDCSECGDCTDHLSAKVSSVYNSYKMVRLGCG